MAHALTHCPVFLWAIGQGASTQVAGWEDGPEEEADLVLAALLLRLVFALCMNSSRLNHFQVLRHDVVA